MNYNNGSYVLGIISLIMVSVSCVLFVFYNVGGGRKSNSKNVRYAGYLGKLLFAASVILLSVSVLNGFAKGEGFRENLKQGGKGLWCDEDQTGDSPCERYPSDTNFSYSAPPCWPDVQVCNHVTGCTCKSVK